MSKHNFQKSAQVIITTLYKVEEFMEDTNIDSLALEELEDYKQKETFCKDESSHLSSEQHNLF